MRVMIYLHVKLFFLSNSAGLLINQVPAVVSSASKYQQMMMYPSTECFLSGIMVKVDHKWKRISLDKLDQCVFVYFLEIISGKFSITKNYSFMFIFLKHDDLSVFNLKQNNI